jgi:DNA-binding transcriptional ArsR family regulator
MRRDIFQAIADPTRRAIIALIAVQAMTPNAIAENFNTTRQAVSKHLRILTECELVTQANQGREIYYSLEVNKMKEIDQWLEQYRKIWETRFNQLDQVLSTIKKRKMNNQLLFDFIVDKTAKTVTVNKEFNAELSLVWDAFTKQKFLTNGGHQNHGNQEQNL